MGRTPTVLVEMIAILYGWWEAAGNFLVGLTHGQGWKVLGGAIFVVLFTFVAWVMWKHPDGWKKGLRNLFLGQSDPPSGKQGRKI